MDDCMRTVIPKGTLPINSQLPFPVQLAPYIPRSLLPLSPHGTIQPPHPARYHITPSPHAHNNVSDIYRGSVSVIAAYPKLLYVCVNTAHSRRPMILLQKYTILAHTTIYNASVYSGILLPVTIATAVNV